MNFPGTETTKVYIAILAFALNVIVAVVLTAGAARGRRRRRAPTRPSPDDYTADVGDEDVQTELDPEGATH